MPVIFRVCMVLCVSLCAAGVARGDAGKRDFHLGGAARFNYGWLDYGPDPGFDLELMRVDARGSRGRAFFSLQYRWYEDFDAVHHVWAGWRLDEESDVRIGVQQVPFGLLPYASHSFWFGSGYYLGLEDDYDPGVVWQRRAGGHRWHAAMFFGDEYGTGMRTERYSFDVATTDDHPYRERNRVHLRYQNDSDVGGGTLALGASLFAGRIEDRRSGGRHDHRGAALHAQWTRDGWTLQAQWARYRYEVPQARVSLSAFMFPFDVAAEADVPTFNIAWALPRTGWFDGITCYNNLSMTRPVGDDPSLRDSWQNVTGCSFARDRMVAYVDWIAGRNMWFAGGPGVGIDEPGGDRWRSRLNVNLGFYF